MDRGASTGICKTLMVHTVSFLPKPNLNLHAKRQIWGTVSAHKIGCCGARKDIYCCLSVS